MVDPDAAGAAAAERGSSGRMAAGSAGLSPHVTVAFALFLRLPGYAELLVAQDRRKAQRLLRLAMGLSPAASAPKRLDKEEGGAWLFLLPFTVLSRLYAGSGGWAEAAGRALRERSLAMGIPQLLLTCLAAFGHQEPVRVPADPARLPPPVHVVHQLLAARDTSAKGGGKAAEGGGTGGQYWAKGTGFGTGSTAQQWNIDLHNIRRQQDEQNVTVILRVRPPTCAVSKRPLGPCGGNFGRYY